jgi:hypothetical protein
MIVTDGVHIAGTSLKELHAWCAVMGIKRCWFHPHPKHSHYDRPKRFRLQWLLDGGAHLVDARVLLSVVNGARAADKRIKLQPYGLG